MKSTIIVLAILCASSAAYAKDACRVAADEAIANSRDSDATFDSVKENTYTYVVSRGHDESCFYDIYVKVKSQKDGTCKAGKPDFDSGSANCG
jgi:hypothetical protein